MSIKTQSTDTDIPQKSMRFLIPSFRVWRNAFVGLVLVSPLLLRAWFLSKVPEIQPFDVDAFCRVEIPSGQNAFDYYREAGRLSEAVDAVRKAETNDALWANMDEVFNSGWSVAQDPLKKWLEDYRPALIEWRRGTERPDAVYMLPGEVDFTMDMTEQLPNKCMRHFARLARCEAVRLEAEGNFDDARVWYIAIFRSGCHLTRHAFSIQRQIGSALQSMSTAGLVHWAEDPQVTGEQLRAALNEVRAADRMTEPVSTTLKAEYVLARNTFNRPGWSRIIGFGGDDEGEFQEPMATLGKVILWVFGEPQMTDKILRQILANQLNEVDKPLPEQLPRVGLGKAFLYEPDPSLPRKPNQLTPDAINRAVARVFLSTQLFIPNIQAVDRLMIPDARDRARLATLKVAFAAQAYRREHGEFPEDRTALVPTYLDVWPVDPSDKSGQPIRYRRDNATSAVVWSVSTDGVDDSGDVIPTEKGAPDIGMVLKTR